MHSITRILYSNCDQRASWEHPNLGEENLNIPLASDYPWIGLRPAQDSPFHLGLHSIFGTYFHIWKTIDGKYGIEGYAIFGRPHAGKVKK